ncbi:MAG: 50S ribosomal protein L32 [Bacteroidota bacterium]
MAHPKRKTSVQRRDKRRTHQKLKEKHLSICTVTGVHHLPHVAYEHEGKLYYRGNVVLEKQVAEKNKT